MNAEDPAGQVDGRQVTDRSRVRQLSPALNPLWRALHERFSAGRVVQRVRVGPLDAEQRGAIADLFGLLRLPGEYTTVTLADLDDVLDDVTGCTAYEVVAQLVGPIGDRAAERRSAATARNSLWEWLSGHEVVQAQPALAAWVVAMRRNGLIEGSVERTRELLGHALGVLKELPGVGIPLPVFADTVLGDPHALDEGTRLHTMVVRALAALYSVDPPSDAGGLRALWDRASIADDELSSTVLTAGLRITTERAAIGQILHLCAEAGQAAALTLQQLRASAPIVGAPTRVWVVENPSLLALALARFGVRCPPMICTSGWPSSAGVRLLQQLSAGGAELHYHGDFDGEGLRIAANIVARVGAIPWRMSSADYLAAVGGAGPSVGRVTPVPWDPDLSAHMIRVGTAVPEERVANVLLDQLEQRQVSRAGTEV
ncbi:TIGR02679 family protein [Nocardia sp. NPDC060256]|uniref:TIGR02679 family protein n=1 Tax=unclassified Nocardia TaxID=2637762 RepID=UPI0036489B70